VSSRLLLTLINNLLDVRKCDDSLLDGFQLSSVSLAKSLQEATDFCRPIGSITNVDISSHVGEDCQHILVQSNAIRIQQVLVNLVSNAIKYTKPGSNVRISATIMTVHQVNQLMDQALECGLPLQRAGEHHDDETEDASSGSSQESLVAVVSVSDTGDGVPVSSAGKVFQRFSESTATRSINVIGQNTVAQPTGTGLGLNLCVKFVERMHGNIWVTNNSPNAGGGAKFSFYLPITAEGATECTTSDSMNIMAGIVPSAAKDAEVESGTTLNTIRSGVGDYRVLVVDDTPINLKVMDRMLRRIGLNQVKTLDSGAKALAFLEKEPVDVVLTDIQMPHMSGHELCEKIIQSAEKIVSSPALVAMTAETSEQLHERCKSSGIIHILHKPITAAELERFFSETIVGLLVGRPTSR